MAGTGLTGPSGSLTTIYTDKQTSGQAENYITDTGAANALVGTLTTIDGSSVALNAGLRVTLKTSNALQAGANTFNLNGGGVKDITTTSLRNLKTIVVAGAILDMVYDGTRWQILSNLVQTI